MAPLTDEQTKAVIAVIRALGFVGNAHYCPGCLNHFHEDHGQHEADCTVLSELRADDDWWAKRELFS